MLVNVLVAFAIVTSPKTNSPPSRQSPELDQQVYNAIIRSIQDGDKFDAKDILLDPRVFNRWDSTEQYDESHPMFGVDHSAFVVSELRAHGLIGGVASALQKTGRLLSNTPAQVDTSQLVVAVSSVTLEDSTTAEVQVYLRTRNVSNGGGRNLVSWQIYSYTIKRSNGTWSVAAKHLRVTS